MTRTDEALKTFVGIKRAQDYLEQIARADIKHYPVNLNEFLVLELLYHKGRHPIQKIKEKILIASSSTTYIIDKLCEKELVKRTTCEEDRRVIYAEITPQGREKMKEWFPLHAAAITEGFSRLTTQEMQQLRELLKKLTNYKSEGAK